MRGDFEIGGETVAPGERRTVTVPIGSFSNSMPMGLPVHVIHGRQDGPVMFVSAAIHGDEVLGVEIIRRVKRTLLADCLAGTLMLIPVVNAYGLISHTRYLPDRRDLNRFFPGNQDGSLASRLAHVFMTEVVLRSDLGIDLHTGALHRSNLPQIRTDVRKARYLELAQAFNPPVILHSDLRDGSLRSAAKACDVPVLLYEAGEALRFDEFSIRAGVRGVLSVMQHLDMVEIAEASEARAAPILSRSSRWIRAPEGGIFRAAKTIGDSIALGETIGAIADPFGEEEIELTTRYVGIIIGRTHLPIVNQGDALFHVATVSDPNEAEGLLDRLEQSLDADPLFDDDALI